MKEIAQKETLGTAGGTQRKESDDLDPGRSIDTGVDGDGSNTTVVNPKPDLSAPQKVVK